jgi:hypothetical protein
MSRRFVLIPLAVLLAMVLIIPALGSRIGPMFSSTAASLDGGGGAARGSVSEARSPASSGASAPAAPASTASSPTSNAAQAQLGVLPSLDRLVVRNISLTLAVPNVQDAYRQVERIAADQGGLIAGSQIRQEGDRFTASVTVRVPADATTYQATLDRLRAIADRVVEEQGQTQDVSEEYVDLESRLRNLRATEDSLLVLYGRAQRLEDVFAVQREITTIRGQIEQIEGRKQALERKAAMATIALQLREPATLAPRQREWSPVDVAADALGALSGVLRGVSTVAIWLAVWLPLYGLPLVALWLLRHRLRALLS